MGARRRLKGAPGSGTIAALPSSFLIGNRGNGAQTMNPTSTETPVVKSTTAARQGVTGHNVRYVLLIGTTAVIVIFAALWLFYFH